MLIIYLIVRLGGKPALFSHIRVGEGGRKFACYKFRTMCIDADQRLEKMLAENIEIRNQWETFQKLPSDPRVTPIGHFLRRTSLDELPQLFNVIVGDMSLVGPRPVCEEELARYGEDSEHYLICRPGMTGLWQISGRNLLTYEDRVYLDSLYARRRSLLVDIVIMLFTIKVVISRDGAV
jgi:undecaprenyl-phosphate galactose phosphotransferase